MTIHFAKPDASVLRTFSEPMFVKLCPNLTAAKFDLMKFTPAKSIIENAFSSGRLVRGGHVMESSSGTFALALAILCSQYGLHLTLVTGPVSRVVRWRLESLGAKLHVVNQSNLCEGGIQQARLGVLAKLLEESPDAFWPQQYTNPLNAASYRPFPTRLLDEGRRFDTLVGTVGSGGSLFGFARVLLEDNPDLKVVAVDHNRSVIFGAKASTITRMCRESFEQVLAMGAGIPMGNVSFQDCDEVHWVPVPKMVQQVHQFHTETGLLVGASSGAALTVAKWHAEQEPDRNVLTILPDHGVRYVETLFDPEWLGRWPEDLRATWDRPEDKGSLEDITEGWCRMTWGRKPFEAVAGHPPLPRHAGYNP
ncbi:pyridoxal-phosphate dependent enzyme [Paracoccus mangrovi]|uniref:Pyridoxal-phosphate dependent enzyme n=1 Tax=Paracoccus mangrovi TaxID=1715645 RepID=A0ABV7RAR4_9RHOB